tara:strand:+ start:558 stop:788 length:231 start_codon:yes stop_codon:yes gene_type:complete
MFFQLKKVFFNTAINFIFFILLLISIQNSSNKAKVDLLVNETIELPIGFIIGTSFITGTLLGGFISLNLFNSKNSS